MTIASSKDYDHFEFLLPPGKQWFSAKEVASVIGRTGQYVRDAFDNQKILGHQANASARRGREQRRTYQVHREAILLFLLQTANYRPDDFLRYLQELLANRSLQQLSKLHRHLTSRLNAAR
jgi:prophage antirepressor-like protein